MHFFVLHHYGAGHVKWWLFIVCYNITKDADTVMVLQWPLRRLDISATSGKVFMPLRKILKTFLAFSATSITVNSGPWQIREHHVQITNCDFLLGVHTPLRIELPWRSIRNVKKKKKKKKKKNVICVIVQRAKDYWLTLIYGHRMLLIPCDRTTWRNWSTSEVI